MAVLGSITFFVNLFRITTYANKSREVIMLGLFLLKDRRRVGTFVLVELGINKSISHNALE
jgi:hypothetical protein